MDETRDKEKMGQREGLVFKRYGDKVIVSRKPDLSDHEPTEAQLAHRERFRQAVLFGEMVRADPEAKAIYDEAAEARGKPMLSLAVADFFNAPSVDEVDLSGYGGQVGDEIAIRASDDFDVVGVRVALTGADGTPIEEGAAAETPPDSVSWVLRGDAGGGHRHDGAYRSDGRRPAGRRGRSGGGEGGLGLPGGDADSGNCRLHQIVRR
jgi:hypothetical protein